MANQIPFSEPQLPLHQLELFSRATQFRDAATLMANMINGRPNWPKWALVVQTIELVLKAAIVSFGERGVQQPVGPVPANHDLSALYDYATKYGMISRPDIVKDLPHLSELSATHYARYPQVPVKPVALISQYDDLIDQIFADVRAVLFPP
jgi:hypothetical protein